MNWVTDIVFTEWVTLVKKTWLGPEIKPMGTFQGLGMSMPAHYTDKESESHMRLKGSSVDT